MKTFSLFPKTITACFFSLVVCVGFPLVTQAQSSSEAEKVKLQPLRKGVNIYDFTGHLNWETTYFPTGNGLDELSHTEFYIAFRNIKMLSSHFGIGYQFFTSVFFSGIFEHAGLGGVGVGPVVRYYPLKSKRWQPYLQAGFTAGYNLALGNDGNSAEGFHLRGSLEIGLVYKVTNTFGLFIEAGPSWGYNRSLQLDFNAIQLEIGIVLYF